MDMWQNMERWLISREIAQEYDNGEMDIITNGTIVFRILEIIKKIPDKLYSGAIVNYPENAEVYHRKELMQVVIKAIRELHRILNISKDFRKPDEELNAYDLAHHAGLSIEEEYEMLGTIPGRATTGISEKTFG